MAKDRSTTPIVYSCSGCSSAAQMANHVALELDRREVAEMSCIAGVGGDVPSLVKLAKSGRPVVVIDGCPLVCARSCLARHGVTPVLHAQLGELGVRKRYHAQYDPAQAETITLSLATAVRKLAPHDGSASATESGEHRVAIP